MARSSTPFEDFKATEKDDQENNQDLGVSFYKTFFLRHWHFYRKQFFTIKFNVRLHAKPGESLLKMSGINDI